MEQITIRPMQWAQIKDLHEVAPLEDSDFFCMGEIKKILEKHNKLDRFALHLIHKHFDIAEDEVLVEYNETENREQFFKVEKLSSYILENSIPTTWTLENIEPLARCVCAYRVGTGHLGRHEEG